MKRILIAELSEASSRLLEPLLDGTQIKIGRISTAREAISILRHHPLDGLVVGFPLDGLRLGELLETVRGKESASRGCRILVAVDRELRGRLSPYLGEGGIDGVVSPGEELLLLQHEVSALLGVARRAAVRLMVRIVESSASTAQSIFCQSVDLSLSGVLVETYDLLPVGTDVRFKLFLPEGGTTVVGHGDVVRHTNPNRDACHGLAVRFKQLHGEGEAALARLLEDDDCDLQSSASRDQP